MAAKSQGNSGNAGKIALLAGLILVAVALVISAFLRSSDSSGTISPEVKQMKAGTRDRKRSQAPTNIDTANPR